MSRETEASDRRRRIAEAGIELIARDGVRALTHRAVDREAGIPQGSTSYYAKTRRALLELIVEALAGRSLIDTGVVAGAIGMQSGQRDRIEPDQAAEIVATMVSAMAARKSDMRARYALIMELDGEPELRTRLMADSAVNRRAEVVAADLLERVGVSVSEGAVGDLIALTDALVFQHTILDQRDPVERILQVHFRGLLS